MPGFYPYVVASLPALHFGMKPPFPFGRFLDLCRDLIPAGDHALLAALPGSETASCARAVNRTMRAWRAFETMIRNELVEIRAARRHADPAKYLRPDGCPESSYAAHIAINAYRKISPLDGERMLDLERWRRLDELAFGHYFDVDTLIIYGARLLILEKWDRINGADGARLLESSLVHAGTGYKE